MAALLGTFTYSLTVLRTVVSISNKAVFSEPVSNSTAVLDHP